MAMDKTLSNKILGILKRQSYIELAYLWHEICGYLFLRYIYIKLKKLKGNSPLADHQKIEKPSWNLLVMIVPEERSPTTSSLNLDPLAYG